MPQSKGICDETLGESSDWLKTVLNKQEISPNLAYWASWSTCTDDSCIPRSKKTKIGNSISTTTSPFIFKSVNPPKQQQQQQQQQLLECSSPFPDPSNISPNRQESFFSNT